MSNSQYSSDLSRSRESKTTSSKSHQRWMNKLNEYSNRKSRSWKRSEQKLPPHSPKQRNLSNNRHKSSGKNKNKLNKLLSNLDRSLSKRGSQYKTHDI